MGADRASVKLGSKGGGVVKMIKNHSNRPFVPADHCSTHTLSYKIDCKKSSLFTKIDGLLQIYISIISTALNRENLNLVRH